MSVRTQGKHRRRSPARRAALFAVLALAIAPATPCADPLDVETAEHVQVPTAPLLRATVPHDSTHRVRLDESRRDPADLRKFQTDWIARVQSHLDRVGHGDLANFPGRRLDEEVYFEDVNGKAFRSVQRATGRALRDYLMEETGITRLLDSVGDNLAGTKLGGKMSGRAVGIDFGISHFLPEVRLTPRVAEGQMRISVRASGSVGVEYRTPHLGRGTRVGTRLDPVHDRYTFSYRIDF